MLSAKLKYTVTQSKATIDATIKTFLRFVNMVFIAVPALLAAFFKVVGLVLSASAFSSQGSPIATTGFFVTSSDMVCEVVGIAIVLGVGLVFVSFRSTISILLSFL